MKKITRNEAVNIFTLLGSMSLGHLSDEMLGNVMDNFNECRKVQDEMNKLNEELTKRLYADVDEKRKEDFFEAINRAESLLNKAKVATLESAKKLLADYNDVAKLIEDSYSDVNEIYKKHLNVYAQLLNKEIEVDFHEIDADEFIKGVIKGKADAPIHNIRGSFAPMFKAEEEKAADLSELDELLK